MDLKGKRILMTGATGGIGTALLKELSAQAAQLILVGKSTDEFSHLDPLLGPDYRRYFADFTSPQNVQQLVAQIKGDFESLDILINGSGIGIYKPIEDLTFQEFQDSLNINLVSHFIVTKELLPLLQKSNDSLILAIDSGMGTIPTKNRSAYCTSKFALRGLMLSLAEEFKDRHPQFCLITLGSTLTTFGGISVAEKERRNKTGQAYFPVDFVAQKLVEFIKDNRRPTEYTLYPADYGFGTWKKP